MHMYGLGHMHRPSKFHYRYYSVLLFILLNLYFQPNLIKTPINGINTIKF